MSDPVTGPVTAGIDPRHPAARLGRLLDPGSLVWLHEPDDSGVAAVRGRIDGCKVLAYGTDGTTKGGALGGAGCRRIAATIDLAVRERCPVIGLWHSGGARLTDGVAALDGVGGVFAAMIRASGRVPQISVVLGPAAGGAAYGAALTDVVIMSEEGRMFVTGPDVVRKVTGEDVDMAGLGGGDAHARKSGVVHVLARDEADAYARARRIAALLTRHGVFDRSAVEEPRDLGALLPDAPQRAYDVRALVRAILDKDKDKDKDEDGPARVGADGPAHAGDANGRGRAGGSSFEELQPKWAPNVVVGLGRLAGRTVGVVANNPMRKGGCLDSLGAEKSARFVRMCDALGVPLVVLVDVPGYLPGIDQEWGGVVRRGAKLLHAFGEATVPRVTLVTRKAYGGAYLAMNSRSLGASAVLAWPRAEIAVMGAEAAVGVLHRRRLAAADDDDRDELRRRLTEEQRQVAGGMERGLALGVVDDVIDPAHTRRELVAALVAAPPGRGDHTNIPL